MCLYPSKGLFKSHPGNVQFTVRVYIRVRVCLNPILGMYNLLRAEICIFGFVMYLYPSQGLFKSQVEISLYPHTRENLGKTISDFVQHIDNWDLGNNTA